MPLIQQKLKLTNAEQRQLRIDNGSTYVLNTIVTNLMHAFSVHFVLILEFRLELTFFAFYFFDVMPPIGFYVDFIPDNLKVKKLIFSHKQAQADISVTNEIFSP